MIYRYGWFVKRLKLANATRDSLNKFYKSHFSDCLFYYFMPIYDFAFNYTRYFNSVDTLIIILRIPTFRVKKNPKRRSNLRFATFHWFICLSFYIRTKDIKTFVMLINDIDIYKFTNNIYC